MKNKLLAASVALASVLVSHQALAVPFSSVDPRSFAMGGVGVASGTSANAVFFNPALLAVATEGDDFSFELPMGVRAADPGDFMDAVDAFSTNNYIADLDAAITSFNTAQTAFTALIDATTTANMIAANDQMIAAVQGVNQGLNSLSNKPFQMGINGGLVVGVPSSRFGVSVYSSASVVGGAFLEYTTGDQTTIDGIITDMAAVNAELTKLAAGDPYTLSVITGSVTADPTSVTGLTSNMQVRFAAMTETGVAIAREFGSIAVGITPKFVDVTTYNYKFVGSGIDAAAIDTNQGEINTTNFNVDIGIARDFSDGWKTGFTIKNVIAQEYELVATTDKIIIEPMARFGVMHETSWSAVALDIDLTENAPAGFDTATQYVALGAEFDLFDTAQLRLGVRHNMSDTPYATEVMSAGIGLSPFGVHIDVSVAGNEDEVGAAVQLGFSF